VADEPNTGTRKQREGRLMTTTARHGKHRYVVTISECSDEQAEQVIRERIGYDEDYGFGYGIDVSESLSAATEQALAALAGDSNDAEHDALYELVTALGCEVPYTDEDGD
jgi:hypothetical protein